MSETIIEKQEEAVPETAIEEQLPVAGSPPTEPDTEPDTEPECGPYSVPYQMRPPRKGPIHHETVVYCHLDTYHSEVQRESLSENKPAPACGHFGIKTTSLMANGPPRYPAQNRRLKNTNRPVGSEDSCPGCGAVFAIATPTCNTRIYAVFYGLNHRWRAGLFADRANRWLVNNDGRVLWQLFEGLSAHDQVDLEYGPPEVDRAIEWGLV